MIIERPLPDEYTQGSFFANYISNAHGNEALSLLQDQLKVVQNIYENLSEEKALFAYAPQKWTLKQMLGHITDTERIIQYRALSIARGEKATFLSFDEDAYMAAANFHDQSLGDLLKQYTCTRQSSILLFESFNDFILNQTGNISNYFASVRTLAWFIVGHEQHHLRILKDRYQISF